MRAPKGRQFEIHGNFVKVPANVTHALTMLPRVPSQTAAIKSNFKRKLQHKSSALSLQVIPNKVVQGAKWLITNSSFYGDESIVFVKD